ncbi:MAG: hypothetical protein AB1486_26685 [Planctomycetota bacterium]
MDGAGLDREFKSPEEPASGEPKPKDQENFTDPDSRIMKDNSGGFQQCYNTEIAVDESAQIDR